MLERILIFVILITLGLPWVPSLSLAAIPLPLLAVYLVGALQVPGFIVEAC